MMDNIVIRKYKNSQSCSHCIVTPHPNLGKGMLFHFKSMLDSHICCHCDICEFAIRMLNDVDIQKWIKQDDKHWKTKGETG